MGLYVQPPNPSSVVMACETYTPVKILPASRTCITIVRQQRVELGRRKTRTTGTSTVPTRYDPCDYDIFTKVKEPQRETRYNTRDELIRALRRSIRNINKDGRADGVRRLPKIWQEERRSHQREERHEETETRASVGDESAFQLSCTQNQDRSELVSIVCFRNMFAFSSDERAFNIESYFRTVYKCELKTNEKRTHRLLPPPRMEFDDTDVKHKSLY
ncbi:hypothetical protein ANN_20658 [Periplaneta americana]|uniref:Uncharacterized protein n=1 Tax=Periplaneta americana TaxID=6978 RepID=A0ABQ8SDA0_PERAM|nr:hypothetical protein ANN_20658 [Periplaneta americana]